ncbi:MAG TPA: hypothetical protein VLJ59_08570 [Mycobacteriales bacterium]|nr:hypothetical protein [Mycobacteriales bacterium]
MIGIPGRVSAQIPTTQGLTPAQLREVDQFELAHPLDLAGLERLVTGYTGRPLQVRLNGVDQPLDGRTAQQVIDSRWQARHPAAVSPLSVPTNAFSVGVTLVPISGAATTFRGHGFWDFRDNYVNGSSPDDYSTVEVTGDRPRIRILATDNCVTFNYRGQVTRGVSYLQNGGAGSLAPICGYRDGTTGFALNVDHGFMDVRFQLVPGGRNPLVGAQFWYEHNQGAGAAVSVSAGWGDFTIDYTGGPSHLQKSTNPVWSTAR